jgi:peptidoglycan/LPS O-acetylase OafA/YrhL
MTAVLDVPAGGYLAASAAGGSVGQLPEDRDRSRALDGLRGCAVASVLAYHAHYPWARGGFLGVDMFFVLSGYLITGGLLRLPVATTRRMPVEYLRFLARRGVRLMPALVLALSCAYLLTALAGTRTEQSQLSRCTAAAGGYWMNLPSGERLRCPAIWHVTWSLAAEEQFYVVWPLVLAATTALACWRRRDCRRAVAVVAITLYGGATAWQLVMRVGGASTAQVLFGPSGRSLALLLGCALAAAAPALGRALTRRCRRAAAGVGALMLTGDIALSSAGAGYGTLASVLLAAAATAAVIVGVTGTQTGGLAVAALGSAVPAALGRLSYSLYLFHELAYRVADLVGPRGTAPHELVRWPLCALAAAASYRLVEQPCRRRLNQVLGRRVQATDAQTGRNGPARGCCQGDQADPGLPGPRRPC